MRYVIAVIVGLTILAFGSPVFADDHTWQRPAECEDKDRESPGQSVYSVQVCLDSLVTRPV